MRLVVQKAAAVALTGRLPAQTTLPPSVEASPSTSLKSKNGKDARHAQTHRRYRPPVTMCSGLLLCRSVSSFGGGKRGRNVIRVSLAKLLRLFNICLRSSFALTSSLPLPPPPPPAASLARVIAVESQQLALYALSRLATVFPQEFAASKGISAMQLASLIYMPDRPDLPDRTNAAAVAAHHPSAPASSTPPKLSADGLVLATAALSAIQTHCPSDYGHINQFVRAALHKWAGSGHTEAAAARAAHALGAGILVAVKLSELLLKFPSVGTLSKPFGCDLVCVLLLPLTCSLVIETIWRILLRSAPVTPSLSVLCTSAVFFLSLPFFFRFYLLMPLLVFVYLVYLACSWTCMYGDLCDLSLWSHFLFF